ncbi:hypothetical protein PPROV_000708300 [Pycnococcus provasolii]|uniref:Pirin N-terminal domain-containing protein n=1 Tax=Pycnococcus provasolii TaxID=41880 RepID=A0A830HMC6_9CHLO|nr:hypothetical protein PPROV_000708300 [Pycnococcus provasolii]
MGPSFLSKFVKVPASTLFVSEPPPAWFGNRANPPAASPDAAKWTNANWLKSRFHFSFAEYHDSQRMSFGALRVLNDDLVQPARGFGEHPHRDQEIVTIVLGPRSLTHQDSMGTAETLTRGAVQFMTAGTGVRHQEHNHDPENPLRFLQIWFSPRARGLQPNYGSYSPSSEAEYKNVWSQVVSDVNVGKGKVLINQDVNLFMTEVDAGASAPPLNVDSGRQVYLVCAEGSADVRFDSVDAEPVKDTMVQHDAAMVVDAGTLHLSNSDSSKSSLYVAIDLKR